MLRLACIAAALALLAPPAFANGAFPDSFTILLPPNDPQQLILATNFGLVISTDGGQRWEWACEHGASAGGFRYKWLPPGRLMAVAAEGLVLSDDLGCTWRVAGGLLKEATPINFFVDPSNARRVLAVGATAAGEWRVYESDDGGVTFARVLLAPPADTSVVGVEIAASDPQTIYVATQVRKEGGPGQLQLMRTRDGGGAWQTLPVPEGLGKERLGVITVDQRDPNRLLLRTPDGLTDRVLLSEDGGVTTKMVLEFAGTLTSYLQRADGTILLGGTDTVHGTLFQSKDGGRTFTATPMAPNFRALGERGGHVYAVGDDFLDRFALATSDGALTSWQPILRYQDIAGVRQCGDLPAECLIVCQGMRYRIPYCVAQLVPPDAAASDAGVDAPAGDGPGGVAETPRGCQCRMGGNAPAAPIFLLLGLIVARSRRRR